MLKNSNNPFSIGGILNRNRICMRIFAVDCSVSVSNKTSNSPGTAIVIALDDFSTCRKWRKKYRETAHSAKFHGLSNAITKFPWSIFKNVWDVFFWVHWFEKGLEKGQGRCVLTWVRQKRPSKLIIWFNEFVLRHSLLLIRVDSVCSEGLSI